MYRDTFSSDSKFACWFTPLTYDYLSKPANFITVQYKILVGQNFGEFGEL